MSLPNGYVQLSYIKATGTQYIDIPYTTLSTTEFEVVYETPVTSQVGFIFAANDNSSHVWIGTETYDIKFGGTYYGQRTITAGKHTLLFNNNGVYLDGTRIYTNGISNRTNTHINLFSNSGHNEKAVNMKMFSISIKTNGTQAFNLIPAKRENDSEIGLFDLVSGVFYGNDGTGTFESGLEYKHNIILEDNPLVLTLENDISLQANFKKTGGKKYIIAS